jgi:hypothetical protein
MYSMAVLDAKDHPLNIETIPTMKAAVLAAWNAWKHTLDTEIQSPWAFGAAIVRILVAHGDENVYNYVLLGRKNPVDKTVLSVCTNRLYTVFGTKERTQESIAKALDISEEEYNSIIARINKRVKDVMAQRPTWWYAGYATLQAWPKQPRLSH